MGPQWWLLVVVDQFEELLTQATPGQRARFVELLRPALAGPVRVVGTLRPEFVDRLLADPDLAILPADIYPLRREALRLVIECPARLAGTDIEADLVDRLANDTGTEEGLPLLGSPLTGHRTQVLSIGFAPDGRTLAPGSGEGTVILWERTALNQLREHTVQHACSITHGSTGTNGTATYQICLTRTRETCTG